MAIYHLSLKNISRTQGRSAVACAAYRAGERLRDERTGELKDYTRKGNVLHSEIILPQGAPAWARGREKLWNAIEHREDRSTRPASARVAREIEIALPHELSLEQNLYLVKDFIKEQLTRKGKAADFSIHAPHREGDERNLHVHIMFSERNLTAEGFGNKDRTFIEKKLLENLRQGWEKHANRHLERWGIKARVDCRTLEAQGIDREPTQHLGPNVVEMERRGIRTDRGDGNRAVAARNEEYAQIQAEHRDTVAAFKEHQARVHEARAAERVEAAQHAPESSPFRMAVRGMERNAEQGLRVVTDVATGATEKLTDFLEGCLDFFTGSPQPKKYTAAELARSPEARRDLNRQQVAEKEARAARDQALDNIREAIKTGNNLSAADVRNLTQNDMANIRAHGDARMMDLIRAREEELEKERRRRQGRERERER